MSNKILSTLNIGNNSYEIDDAFARQKIEEVDNNLLKINPVYSTSGSVVSFDDGADNLPLDELIVDINPVQDLHGYDHPWIGGSGKNLFDKEKPLVEGKYISNNGSIQNMTNYQYSDYYTPVEANTSYIFSCTYFGSGYNTISFYDENKTFLGRLVPPTSQTGASFTTPQDCVYIRFNMGRETILSTLQLEKGSVATDYEPYENICPITGWTGMNVQRCGKNLFDKSAYTSSDITYHGESEIYTRKGIRVDLPSGTYTINCNSDTVYAYIYMFKQSADGNYVDKYFLSTTTTNGWKAATVTIANGEYLVIVAATSGDLQVNDIDLQIEVGSVATEYEPYNGIEIPISWESEAGTVYGGTLDVLNGVLTVDRAFVDLGTLAWSKASSETKYPSFYSNSLKGIIKPTDTSGTVTDAICSDYKATTFDTVYSGNTNSVFAVVNVQSGAKGSFSIIDSRFDNADDFKAAMNGVQFCYPLLEPITYQLTPNEVKSLLGQNNIFTDINSKNILVSYKADIQKCIDKKLNTDETAYKTTSILYGQVDATSTSTKFTATIDDVIEYFDGLTILLKNEVVASASGFTIDINGLGAKSVFSSLNLTSKETTAFTVTSILTLIYDSTLDDGNGGWIWYKGQDKDTNTIGYCIRTNSKSLPLSSISYRYRLLFTSADRTHYVPANNSNSTNTTSIRDVCQEKIDPFGDIIYYGTSTIVQPENRPNVTTLWLQNAFSLGYSFNRTGQALTLELWKPVYIKATPYSDGSAIIDADEPYVQDLPTTNDGKIYIYLGVAYNTASVELSLNHPVYYYHNGVIQLWTGPESFTDDYKNKIDTLWADYQSRIGQ